MADTAMVSVIASGTVGALGALTPWFGRKNEQDKRAEERRNDFRVVLDEASQVLAKALGHLPQDTHEDPDLPQLATRLSEDIAEVRAHSARLGVRVGARQDVNRIYSSALVTLVSVLRAARRRDPGQVYAATYRVQELYAGFQDAASERVGVAPPSSRRSAS
jgi:hypothetical protein